MAQLLLTTYYLTLALLALYGVHRFVLLSLYARYRRKKQPTPADPEDWPVVTVQLPLYNEMYVAPRLLEAVCRLDYRRQSLEIQLLDDSTDETTEILARRVEELREEGFNIQHLHRRERCGFKAGALEEGLRHARGDLVAVFDADFVPPPNFLKVTVPHFADPRVGMVQARWDHVNRRFSLLTRIQAIVLDGHFVIEHAARHWSGRFFNFNGTAGVWRREAITDAGGWQHDTLTEDLDLSYRAQLSGWRFVYLSELVAPAELPVDVEGFKSQQHRWAKGSIQTARKLLGRIFRAPVPWWIKLEAFIHLTNNSCYFLMVLLSGLIFPAMVLRQEVHRWALVVIDLPLFFAATVSVLSFYIASQRAAGRGWWTALRTLPGVMGIGIGLSINNASAVLSGLLARGGTFNRTPKYRIERRGESWRHKKYRTASSHLFLVEGVFAVYFLLCVGLAVRWEMWLALPFLYLFLQGYSYIFLLSVLPRLAACLPRPGPPLLRPAVGGG